MWTRRWLSSLPSWRRLALGRSSSDSRHNVGLWEAVPVSLSLQHPLFLPHCTAGTQLAIHCKTRAIADLHIDA